MDNTKINAELERFKKGFPWLEIVDPATPKRGIEVLTPEAADRAEAYCDEAEVAGRCKFVPASGAASRMFKDIFAGADSENDAVRKLATELEKFAFYVPDVFGTAPYDPCKTAHKLLDDSGLGYGKKPKGVLKFHRYPDEVRTAIAEHFVEGQAYMRNADGGVKLIVTISPEHRELFEAAVAEIKDKYEKRYGVRYEVEFTYQDKATDTVAATPDNKPFLKADGTPLFRPAGHGALIHNLGKVEEELVSIKNIDNVCVERMQPITYKWKKVLMGRALELRDKIFNYLYTFDQLTELRKNIADMLFIPGNNVYQDDPFATPEVQELCNEVEQFLYNELCIEMPPAKDCRDRAEALIAKLNRPIRVCGMDPGGEEYAPAAEPRGNAAVVHRFVKHRDAFSGGEQRVDPRECAADSSAHSADAGAQLAARDLLPYREIFRNIHDNW